MVAPQVCDIEIFGQPAGRLIADGDLFIFHAADQTHLELDRCSFKGLDEAEQAVHQVWLRRMHRCAGGLA